MSHNFHIRWPITLKTRSELLWVTVIILQKELLKFINAPGLQSVIKFRPLTYHEIKEDLPNRLFWFLIVFSCPFQHSHQFIRHNWRKRRDFAILANLYLHHPLQMNSSRIEHSPAWHQRFHLLRRYWCSQEWSLSLSRFSAAWEQRKKVPAWLELLLLYFSSLA